jgi:hypothetical protein
VVPRVVVGVQVEPAADGRELHLVQPQVSEDRQVPGREDLVDVLLVGDGDLQVVEYLLRQRVIKRRGNVGQQKRHLAAEHPDCHEEVVIYPGEPDSPGNAGLLPQHPDESGEVGRHRHRQYIGLPLIVLAEDDDCKVRLAHLGHRHAPSMPRTGGCCQIDER